MKKILLLTLTSCMLLLSSCATVLSGTKDDVTFNSTPSGATILIDGIQVGKTPSILSVKRPGFGEKTVTIKLKGYDDRTFMLSKTFNMMTVCNLNNPLGWLIDIVTGTIFKYDKTNYSMDLEPRAYNLNDLDVDQFGSYIIPDILNRDVIVYDEEMDVEILFQ